MIQSSIKVHRIGGGNPLFGRNDQSSETHLQSGAPIGIHKERIQLIKIHNEGRIHTILHFSTNRICFIILSGYSILGNEQLVILHSWAQEFLSNFSDTVKAFFFFY